MFISRGCKGHHHLYINYVMICEDKTDLYLPKVMQRYIYVLCFFLLSPTSLSIKPKCCKTAVLQKPCKYSHFSDPARSTSLNFPTVTVLPDPSSSATECSTIIVKTAWLLLLSYRHANTHVTMNLLVALPCSFLFQQ